jgi:hypothetical protein
MHHRPVRAIVLSLILGTNVVVGTPAPVVTPAPRLEDAVVPRAAAASSACTFSGSLGYSSASVSKASCSTIVLSSLQVPGGKTLDLEKLNDGTVVIFEGTTTFGYAEWEGSLFSVSGNKITVKGNPGSVLDGQGALYWDGQGGSGGVTKPKFFKANHLNDSVVDGITIRNAPKNSFSLNYVYNLTVKDVTVDDKDGTALGKNTDAFNSELFSLDPILLSFLLSFSLVPFLFRPIYLAVQLGLQKYASIGRDEEIQGRQTDRERKLTSTHH